MHKSRGVNQVFTLVLNPPIENRTPLRSCKGYLKASVDIIGYCCLLRGTSPTVSLFLGSYIPAAIINIHIKNSGMHPGCPLLTTDSHSYQQVDREVMC